MIAHSFQRQAGAGAIRSPHRVASQRRTTVTRAAVGKLPRWDVCYDLLVNQKKLETVDPVDAKALVDSSEYVLVDVRTPANYKQSHPVGAVNVPMYRQLDWSKPDIQKVFRFVAYSFNGVSPVEPNPDFIEQMQQILSGGKGAITLCEAGGTLKPSTNFPLGKTSRSLQAAYRLFAEGITDKVKHLDRGAYGWYQADLPFEGEGKYEPDLGRTPMAAPEPNIRAIREATGYQMREGDKK